VLLCRSSENAPPIFHFRFHFHGCHAINILIILGHFRSSLISSLFFGEHFEMEYTKIYKNCLKYTWNYEYEVFFFTFFLCPKILFFFASLSLFLTSFDFDDRCSVALGTLIRIYGSSITYYTKKAEI